MVERISMGSQAPSERLRAFRGQEQNFPSCETNNKSRIVAAPE